MTKERKNFYDKLDRYLKKISKKYSMSIFTEQCGTEQNIIMGLYTFSKTIRNHNNKILKEIEKELKEKFMGVKFSQIRNREFYDCYGSSDYGSTLEMHILFPY